MLLQTTLKEIFNLPLNRILPWMMKLRFDMLRVTRTEKLHLAEWDSYELPL